MPIDLSRFDAIVNKKRLSVEEKRQRKQAYLEQQGTLGTISGNYDGDTISFDEFDESIRLDGINTYEVPQKWAYSTEDILRRDQQVEAAKRIYGDDVTYDDVHQLGLKAKDHLANIAPAGTKAYFVPAKPQDIADATNMGDRRLGSVYRADTLEDITTSLQGKQLDAAHYAPWNAEKRRQEYYKNRRKQEANKASGYDAEGNPELGIGGDGLYVYGSKKSLTRNALDAAIADENIVHNALTEAWSSNIDTPIIEGAINLLARVTSGIGQVTDIAKQSFYEGIRFGGGVTVEQKVSDWNDNFKQWERDEEGNKVYHDGKGNYAIKQSEIDLFAHVIKMQEVGMPLPQKIIDFLQTDNAEKLAQFYTDAIRTKTAVEEIRADRASANTRVDRIADADLYESLKHTIEKEGVAAAIWEAVTNHSLTGAAIMIESVPTMVAMSVPGLKYATMTAMWNNYSNDGIREFQANNGRAPTDDEILLIKGYAAQAVAFEKLGAAYLLKGMPKIALKALEKAPKSLNYMTMPIRGFIIEGISGGGTEASQQLAATAGEEITDPTNVKVQAIIEGLGGGTLRAPIAAKQALSSEILTIEDVDESPNIEDIEPQIVEPQPYTDLPSEEIKANDEAVASRIKEITTQFKKKAVTEAEEKELRKEHDSLVEDRKSFFTEVQESEEFKWAKDTVKKERLENAIKVANAKLDEQQNMELSDLSTEERLNIESYTDKLATSIESAQVTLDEVNQRLEDSTVTEFNGETNVDVLKEQIEVYSPNLEMAPLAKPKKLKKSKEETAEARAKKESKEALKFVTDVSELQKAVDIETQAETPSSSKVLQLAQKIDNNITKYENIINSKKAPKATKMQAEAALSRIKEVSTSLVQYTKDKDLLKGVRESLDKKIKKAKTTKKASQEARISPEFNKLVYSLEDDKGPQTQKEYESALNKLFGGKKAVLTKEEKQAVRAKKHYLGVKEALGTGKKSLKDVNKEITAVSNGRFKSFPDLVKAASTPETKEQGMAELENFAAHMKKKSSAFRRAITKARKEGKTVYVSKDTFKATSRKPTVKNIPNYYWAIDPKTSSRLVNTVAKEAKVGEAALKSVKIIDKATQTKPKLVKTKEGKVDLKDLDALFTETGNKITGKEKAAAKLLGLTEEEALAEIFGETPKKPVITTTEEVSPTTGATNLNDYYKGLNQTVADSTSKTHIADGIAGKTFSDIFVQNKKDTPTVLFDDPTIYESERKLIGALTKAGLTNTYAASLAKQFTKFREKFNQAIGGDVVNHFAQAPLSMVHTMDGDKVGNIPDPVIFAVMLGTNEWISQSSDTGKPDTKTIADILFGNQKQYVPPSVLKKLDKVGTPYETSADTIGNIAISLLNIKPTDSAEIKNAYFYKEALAQALGMAAITTLTKLKDKDGKFLAKFETHKKLGEVLEGQGPVFYPRSVTLLSSSTSEEVKNIRKYTDQYGTDIDSLSAEPIERFNPSSEPIPIVTEVVNSFFNAGKKLIKDLRQKHNDKWEKTTPVYERFHNISTAARDALIGKKSEKQLKEEHIDDRISLEKRNDALDRELAVLNRFDSIGVFDKIFYLGSKFMPQHRVQMRGPINPLTSKMHRHLFNLDTDNVTVDSPESRLLFKLAIVQLMGEDIDKNSILPALNTFDKIMENPAVKRAVDNINDMDILSETLIEIMSSYKRANVSALEAVVAIADYKKSGFGKRAFNTTVRLELDGVTNGLAFNLMQFPGSMVDIENKAIREEYKVLFNQVGITFADQDGDLGQRLDDKGKIDEVGNEDYPAVDAYQQLGKFFNKFLDLSSGNLMRLIHSGKTTSSNPNDIAEVAKTEELARAFQLIGTDFGTEGSNTLPSAVLKAMRSLAKGPFLLTMYSAGAKSATEEILFSKAYKGIWHGFTSELAKKQKEYNEVTTSEVKDKIHDEVAALMGNFNTIIRAGGAKADAFSLGSVNAYLEGKGIHNLSIEPHMRHFAKAGLQIFKPMVEKSFQEMMGPMLEVKENLLKAAEMQAMLFIKVLKKKVDEYKKANEGVRVTTKVVNDIIKEELLDLIPHFTNSEGSTIQLIKTDKGKDTRLANHRIQIVGRGLQKGFNTGELEVAGYVSPGASAGVNPIHNLDSLSIALVNLESDGAYLSLFDAMMSGINTILSQADTYNEVFVPLNESNNIFDYIINTLRSSNMKYLSEHSEVVAEYPKLAFHNRFEKSKESYDSAYAGILKSQGINNQARNILFTELRKEETKIEQVYHPIISNASLKASESTSREVAEDAWVNGTPVEKNPVKGSIDDNLGTKISSIFSTKDLASNIEKIFVQMTKNSNSFVSETDAKMEIEHLNTIVQKILLPSTNVLNGIKVDADFIQEWSRGGYDELNKKIKLAIRKAKAPTYTGQSSVEVFVHEVLHPIITDVLEHNGDIRSQVEELYDAIVPNLTINDFLYKKNGKIIYFTDKNTEIAQAERQLNYLQKVRTKEEGGYKRNLEEFLIYALTNKHLVAKMKDMDSIGQNNIWWPNGSFIARIMYVVDKIVDIFVRTFTSKSLPKSDYERAFSIATAITAINEDRKSTIMHNLRMDQIGDMVEKANNGVFKVAKTAIKIGSYVLPKSVREHGVSKLLARLSDDIPELAKVKTKEQFAEAFHKMTDSKRRQQIVHLIQEMTYGPQGYSAQQALLQSKYMIESERKHASDGAIKTLTDSFITKLSNIEKTALTKTFLRTDLSALRSIGIPENDIFNILRSPAALDSQINQLKTSLGIAANKYLQMQTEGLAEFMLTRKTSVSNQMLNAHNIYRKARKSNDLPSNAVEQIDAYISLLALKKSPKHYIDDTVKVINREEEANSLSNGVRTLINMHLNYKQKSRKNLFRDKPQLMQKGYVHDILNPYHDMAIVSMDQHNIMLRRGYTFVGKLRNDQIPTSRDIGMFIHTNFPEAGRTSGILSHTARKSMGSSLFDILSSDPKYTTFNANLGYDVPNSKKINKTIRQYTAIQKKLELTANSHNMLIPIVNGKGGIVDYRVTMSQANIEEFLSPDQDVFQIMGKLEGSYVDKKNSAISAQMNVKALADKFNKEYSKSPSSWVNILEGEYFKDHFMYLPEETRELIQERAVRRKDGNYAFFLHKNDVSTVLGHKQLSIANMPIMEKFPEFQNFVRIAEQLLKDFVNLAVVNTVIKTIPVGMANMASNFGILVIMGMNPVKAVRYLKEGISELEAYKANVKKLKDMHYQLRADKHSSNPTLSVDPVFLREYDSLLSKTKGSLVSPLMDKGFFTSISEEVELHEYTYFTRASTKIKNTLGLEDDSNMIKLANLGYISENTQIFQELRHFTQTMDFVSRYALNKYLKEKGMEESKRSALLLDLFVNYDMPMNPYLEYANHVGLVFFVRYWMRIQRALYTVGEQRPASVLLTLATQEMAGVDVPDIYDSAMLLGNVAPPEGGLDKIISDVLQIPLYGAVSDLSRGTI